VHVGDERPKQRNPLAFTATLLQSSAGISAVVLAGLYLAGLTALTIRFRNAGLKTENVIQFLSLDELLRTGLSWLAPALPAILGLGVMLIASIFFERQLDAAAGEYRDHRWPTLNEDSRSRWAEEFDSHRKATGWSQLRRMVIADIAKVDDQALVTRARRFVRDLNLFTVWSYGIAILLFASVLLLTWWLGLVGYFALLIAALLIGTKPASQALPPLFGVIGVMFLVNAVVNPLPLPKAVVVTTAHQRFAGDLVGSPDTAWYLGEGSGRVVVVPSDEVRCSAVQAQPQAESLLRFMTFTPEHKRRLGLPAC
jgi:hypothetical protein